MPGTDILIAGRSAIGFLGPRTKLQDESEGGVTPETVSLTPELFSIVQCHIFWEELLAATDNFEPAKEMLLHPKIVGKFFSPERLQISLRKFT